MSSDLIEVITGVIILFGEITIIMFLLAWMIFLINILIASQF